MLLFGFALLHNGSNNHGVLVGLPPSLMADLGSELSGGGC
jgi:hypothetical protein